MEMDLKVEKIPVYMFSYRKSYYLTHPWKLVKDIWYGIKNLWHRARYGYAYVDAWNMSEAWCRMGANMMLHLAQYGQAYPGGGEFDTPEKWHDHLLDMAQRLRDCADIDWWDKNEVWDEYEKDFENTELKYKWLKRQEELTNERDNLIKETFKIIGENFEMYWD